METLAIGIIRGTKGLGGHVRVESLSEETTHFHRLRGAWLLRSGDLEHYEIESVEDASAGVTLKFRGVDTREDAAALAGSEVHVLRRQAARRRRWEYYAADLVGCSVVRAGRSVGRIVGIVTTGASDLIEIEDESGKSFLVPFIRHFIGRVRLRRRTVELKDTWEEE